MNKTFTLTALKRFTVCGKTNKSTIKYNVGNGLKKKNPCCYYKGRSFLYDY